ncbi:hypothetical protein GCM10027037_22020 [Mucilaginibacter koreensis]
MAIIEPVRNDIEQPERIKKNSASLRLWHWASVLIISGSLITVLINSTVLDEHESGNFIKSKLANPTVTDQQASGVSHALSDEIWGVHIYFGYALAAFLLFRLILEGFPSTKQRFFKKLGKAWKDFKLKNSDYAIARHELAVKITYLVFYITLMVIVVTGLSLAFKKQLGIPRSISHSIKEVHGFCMYIVIAFILVHIIGVILAERKANAGIVSDMINGGRDE